MFHMAKESEVGLCLCVGHRQASSSQAFAGCMDIVDASMPCAGTICLYEDKARTSATLFAALKCVKHVCGAIDD